MAVLYINEFSRGGNLPIAVFPAIATQAVTFTSSTQSSALNAATQIIQLYCASNCFVATGESPTATATSTFVPGGQLVEFGLPDAGYTRKLAVYDGTT